MGHQVRRIQEGSHGAEILAAARFSDLFIWIHSHGHPPTTFLPINNVLSQLRVNHVPSITYHLDLFKGIPERFVEYKSHPYMWGLDHFFSVDPALVEHINNDSTSLTIGHYLTPGVFEPECYISEERLAEPPVIFVGSYNYHNRWPYRRQLIDWLKNEYGDRFKGYGPDFGKSYRGRELNQLYASSKIVVGDTYCPNFSYRAYWSDRTPETLGRGGFLIHPWIEGMDDFYTDHEHLVYYDYGDFDQLRYLIDYYLEHDDEREAIRLAGHRHVKENHTFTNRWDYILGKVK
jgi:hypothetical protein